jgi:hypothetical protein
MELSIAIELLTFFVGLFIGNRLALGNERRKEFNDAASTIYRSLEIQRRTLEKGDFPANAEAMDNDAFIDIQRKLPAFKRHLFTQAINNYVLAKASCGSHVEGEYILDRPEILISAIERLQTFLSHK